MYITVLFLHTYTCALCIHIYKVPKSSNESEMLINIVLHCSWLCIQSLLQRCTHVHTVFASWISCQQSRFNHVPDIYICKRCWSAGSVVSVVCGKQQSLKTRYLMNAGCDTLSSRPWTRLWITRRIVTKQEVQFLESHSLLQNKIHLLLAGTFQKLYCAFRFFLYLWSTY